MEGMVCRALRAEIDETALYSTRSQPFPRPETGKIAVKVINITAMKCSR
jgi:adenine-specific DNA-methyltransferase